MKHEVLRCDNVGKSFGRLRVLEKFNFSLHAGEVVGFVGPSGCGKTTILRLLAQLDETSHGSIDSPSGKPRVAMNFQEPRLVPWMTALENIEIVLSSISISQHEKKKRAAVSLDSVGLNEFAGYYPDQLSGGMKQRVALARSIAYEPDVFIMDEPFSSLDFPLRMQMIELLHEIIHGRDYSVVFVSHDTREITHICDRVLVVNGSPCNVKETIEFPPRSTRFSRPGYLQKMEEYMLDIMMDKPVSEIPSFHTTRQRIRKGRDREEVRM